MEVLHIKIGIALSLSLAALLLLWSRKYLNRFSESQHGPLIASFFVVLRIVPFLVTYVILRYEPRSDVPVFFEAALSALQGKIVYRDFWSPYSPLFAYVTALPVLFWRSAKAIVLLMIVLEGVALWLSWRFYRVQLGREALIRVLLYLLLPGPMVLCVLGGQEDIWMWLFLVISAFVWQQTRNSFSVGAVMALALIVTKALAVLPVVALFFLIEKPFKYLAGLLAVGVPSFALLVWLVGEKFMTPLMFADMPFAPNLWTVLSPVFDFRPYAKVLSWIGLLGTLLIACFSAVLLKQKTTYEKALPVLFSLCFSFMMFFHKSSFSNYAFIFMMPFVIGIMNITSKTQVAVLLLFNAAVVVQPTYWWSLGTPIYTSWTSMLTPRNLIEYLLELTVVGCLAYFLVLLYRNLLHQPGRLGST